MNKKTWSLLTLGVLLAVYASLAALVIAIDPFQIYRLAENYLPPIDNKTQVYSNAGIARNYEYDSIVVGTSVTENFRPRQMDKVLGGRFIKLCSSAGSAYNHAILMDLAFRTHDVRRVVYGLDVYSYMGTADRTATEMPMYLYDDNPFNDVQYWFNRSVLGTYVRRALSTWGQQQTDVIRDTMYAWQDQYLFGPEFALKTASFTPPESRLPADTFLSEAAVNLQTHLIPFIEDHPQTQFDIFFPPYSAAEWATMESKGTFDAMLAMRSLCYDALSGYDNVSIHDFAAEDDWVVYLDNYKDPLHYQQWVNDQIVEYIAEGSNLVTSPAQLDAADAQLRDWVNQQIDAGGWPFPPLSL